MVEKLFIFSILAGLVFISCNKDHVIIDPPGESFKPVGVWQLDNSDSVFIAIGIMENEDSNRVLICDMRTEGNGCMWGHVNFTDHSINFDNTKFPVLLASNPTDASLKLSISDGSGNFITGNYKAETWVQGNCGFYRITGNTIGIVDKNCIIGKWYTLATDPFGGPNYIIYKDYNLNGTGQIVIPDQNKTISFKWNISGYPTNTLLNEYQFSDTSYTNVSYGYECTVSGLALGVQGKSWIRKNLVCY